MSTVSTFLFSVGCLVGAVWELAGYALRFGWALLLPKALLAAHREVRHSAVTAHPTMEWVIQQLREAAPFGEQPRYVFRDNDGIFGFGVYAFLESCGIQEVRTAYDSPWQNPYIERMIGTLRRELLDHVMVLSQGHLQRLLRE